MRRSFLLGAALVTVASVAAAAGAADVPQRRIDAVVYGNDTCPHAAEGEIVVCARRPENERYRIPKALRDKPRTDPPSRSWASRWASLEDDMRFTRPNSCSVVGTFGQTGCYQAMLRQWWLERQAAANQQP